MKYFALILSILVFGCSQHQEEGGTHTHANGEVHAAHGNQEVPTRSFTIWTDSIELFVEFPVFIVGATSRFAAHFTLLNKHQPVEAGSVTVSLIQGKKGIRHTVDTPVAPGIFAPSLKPKQAGKHSLLFELKERGILHRINVGEVTVYASKDEAIHALESEKEENSNIAFLKEQAWKIPFQTTAVTEKLIYKSIPTSGIWKVAPSDHLTLVASHNGRVSFEQGSLMVGSHVKKGQVLLSIQSEGLTSNNLDAEIQKAKAKYDQATAEFERKSKLYQSKVIPKSQLEQAEQKFQIAKTEYENLSKNYRSGAKLIKIPFDGYIKSVDVENGSFVEQGRALFTIAHHTSSLLEVQVSPAFASDLSEIQDLWYQPKIGEWSSLNEKNGKIISITDEVDAQRPMLSVFAEIIDDVGMPEGSYTEVQLAVGSSTKGLVIPQSALLENYGNYSVIVQLSGEEFERREITIGKQNGSEVEVLSGLRLSEYVVSKGAYQVKMASMATGAVGHGHAH